MATRTINTHHTRINRDNRRHHFDEIQDQNLVMEQMMILRKEKFHETALVDEEDDCTTVTLSTTTSERSDSNTSQNQKSQNSGWGARFVRTNSGKEETLLPSVLLDQKHTVSPLATPSSTNQKTRKAFHEEQAIPPPLKEFGAQPLQSPASLQLQSLEAIMAKQQQQQNQQRSRPWWWKNVQDSTSSAEEDSVAAESMTSLKSNGDISASAAAVHWGRFLGSGNDEDNTTTKKSHKRKSWKNRFSFRSMDTMLDDMEDPYNLESISLGSESSSSSSFVGTTTLNVYDGTLESGTSNNHEPNEESTTHPEHTSAGKKTHRRRWSRLWRAQEFSQDAPTTIHMI